MQVSLNKLTKTFWISTVFLCAFEILLPFVIGLDNFNQNYIVNLGYPPYLLYELLVFKVLGAFALLLPQIKNKIKEWAYFGYGLVFLSATIAHLINGSGIVLILLPILLSLCLFVSYWCRYKIDKMNLAKTK